jgi:hydroxyethylthiazole kinase-like sugar kinase family protein
MLTNKISLKFDSSYKKTIAKISIILGNTLTLIGIICLLLGMIGLIHFDSFAFGLSSGVRMIGMIVISGCLLSAVGYGFLDYVEE